MDNQSKELEEERSVAEGQEEPDWFDERIATRAHVIASFYAGFGFTWLLCFVVAHQSGLPVLRRRR